MRAPAGSNPLIDSGQRVLGAQTECLSSNAYVSSVSATSTSISFKITDDGKVCASAWATG